ncbi:MAG: hypothetical protein GXY48_13865 [Methanomicrobiales archaeon]|nr:hypothetical protein [Methanomicrobiales archaeon]
MNWNGVFIGCICLLIAGLVGADSISSTIVCDGSSWVSSSVIGQGQTYAANLFTTDLAVLFRNLDVGSNGKVSTRTNVQSAGPVGVDEYSGQGTNQTGPSDNCVFALPENGTPSWDEINYMGLMQTGQYVSTRTLDPSQTGAVTMVNGSGMILVRAKSVDVNGTEITHTSDVAGNLNMTEKIVFGGDE